MDATETMPAITVRQPFALGIALAHKLIENRGFAPRRRAMPFDLAIHAGVWWREARVRAQLLELEGRGAWPMDRQALEPTALAAEAECQLGHIIAVVRVVGLHRVGDPLEASRARWRDPKYRFAWLFEDVRRLPELVPATGRLSIWNLTPDQHARVAEQLERARSPRQ